MLELNSNVVRLTIAFGNFKGFGTCSSAIPILINQSVRRSTFGERNTNKMRATLAQSASVAPK